MSWALASGALDAACVAAYGQTVTYQPETGAPAAIVGIVRTGARMEGVAPGVYAVLFARMADLPQAPNAGDWVEINSTRYRVFEVEADAAGGVNMMLRRE